MHFCPFFPSGYRGSGLVPTGDFPPPPPPAKGFYVPLPLLSLLSLQSRVSSPSLSFSSLLLFETRNPIRRRGGGVSDDGGSEAFDNVIALCQGFESLEKENYNLSGLFCLLIDSPVASGPTSCTQNAGAERCCGFQVPQGPVWLDSAVQYDASLRLGVAISWEMKVVPFDSVPGFFCHKRSTDTGK